MNAVTPETTHSLSHLQLHYKPASLANPWRGFVTFIQHPLWWGLPLAATFLVILLVLGAAAGIIWWWWPQPSPNEEMGWFTYAWQISRSIGFGLAGGLVTWIICMPLAMALAYEQLQLQILKKKGIETPGEPFVKSILSAVRSLLSALPGQILWLVITLILSWTIPPLGVIAGAWSIGHAMCRESYACCLALCGLPYKDRKKLLKQHRKLICFEGLSAAGLKGLLVLSIIGWVFWLPAVFCGTAVAVKRID